MNPSRVKAVLEITQSSITNTMLSLSVLAVQDLELLSVFLRLASRPLAFPSFSLPDRILLPHREESTLR